MTGLSGFKQDYVTEIVKDWLLSGKYSNGDTLPGNQDLAKLLGVNPRTIAKGLKPLVTEGLIERVPRRGTVVKKALAPITTQAVGLVMLNKGEIYSEMARKINELLSEHNLFPVLMNNDLMSNTNAISDFMNRMVGKTRPHGYLVMGDSLFPYSLLSNQPNKFQNTVFLMRYQGKTELPGCRYVLIDNDDLGRQVVEYFVQHKVKRILFPASFESNYSGPWASMQLQIMHSIRKYAAEAGVIFDDILFMKMFSTSLQKEALREAISRIHEPAGIFSWGETFLFHEVEPILNELGKNMMEDFVVLGNFNTHHAELRKIDSFDYRIDDICRIGVDMLTGKSRERKVLLPAKLVRHHK